MTNTDDLKLLERPVKELRGHFGRFNVQVDEYTSDIHILILDPHNERIHLSAVNIDLRNNTFEMSNFTSVPEGHELEKFNSEDITRASEEVVAQAMVKEVYGIAQ